jgi:hypothetical protein
MAVSHRNLVAFALLVQICGGLAAQDRLEPVRPASTVRLTFRTFALEPPIGLHFQPRPGAALQPISFYSSARSAIYRYQGPADLAFYSGADLQAPVASIDVQTISAPRALLLFRPSSPLAAGRYEVTALPDDLERLPFRSAVVVNLSGRRYRVSLNQRAVELAATNGVTAPMPIHERSSLQLSVPSNEGWRRVTEVDLQFAEQARAWLILFPPYRRGELQPQLRVLHDVPDADDLPSARK